MIESLLILGYGLLGLLVLLVIWRQILIQGIREYDFSLIDYKPTRTPPGYVRTLIRVSNASGDFTQWLQYRCTLGHWSKHRHLPQDIYFNHCLNYFLRRHAMKWEEF